MRAIQYRTSGEGLLEEFVEASLYALHTFEMMEGFDKEQAEIEASIVFKGVLKKAKYYGLRPRPIHSRTNFAI